ncbi:FecR family protein [Dysgonomonas sp. GY75]|uniref:FecR family protein n=1 Tax=Dysgonomonas sp. GY75 TaxID=2780419 RepID=UPI001883FBE1|nr:FecR family protein [Dysgonomonas sp. GY75]MBF0647399.1 FecR family protein [Dysgonomonas sp. GY75]
MDIDLDQNKKNNVRLSDWFEEKINEKLQGFINRIEIPEETLHIADKLKPVILSDVNSRIDKLRKRRRLLMAFSVTAACISLFVVSLMFLKNNISEMSQKELLMSKLDSISLEETEISIIAGNTQKIIQNEEQITQTKEGNIRVGTENEIAVEDIPAEYVTVVVPKGKRTSILFSDGSRIWINSGTKLVYPKVFDEKSRNILVDGEIFIEVKKDDKKPFIVHTKKMDVSVFGTKFNVNAYNNEPLHSVVLMEGSVSVSSNKQNNMLKPGQGFFNENSETSIKDVDVYSYVCWKDGRIQLMDEPFNVLLRRLSRYYGIEIVPSPKVNHYKFEGNLNLRESIDDILRTLSLSKSFKVTKKDNIIYID